MNEVHSVTITISRPMGPDDPGTVEIANYTVDGALVTLTDSSGKPLPRGKPLRRGDPAPTWSRRMRDGEDAQRVARELLWAKYRTTKSKTDFGRTIRYPRSGIV